MKTSLFTRLLALVLSAMVFMGILVIPVSADASTSSGNSSDTSRSEMESYLKAESYFDYIASHKDKPAGPDRILINPVAHHVPALNPEDDGAVAITDATTWENITNTSEGYKSGDSFMYLPKQGKTTWTITISEEQAGMYYLGFSYYNVEGTVNAIERKLYIDGEVPFSEARFLSLSKTWAYSYKYVDDKPTFEEDRIGNSLTPEILQTPIWRTYFCTDSQGYLNNYYAFYFSPGTHQIALEAEREAFVLGEIELVPIDDIEMQIPSFETYKNNAIAAGAKPVNGDATVRFEAETPNMVSDSAVYMTNDRTSAINSPSSPSSQLYNVIGANSYNGIGQWAAYTFEVDQDGLYNLMMRYKQNALQGMYICRIIKLWSSDGQYGLPDGTPTVPFAEAYNTRFDYSDDWQVSCLGDGNIDFEFHFKPGVTYTLYLEVGLGSLAEQLSRASRSLEIINSCYLRILQLTGSNPDKNRIYGFSDIMPDVIYALCDQAVELDSIKTDFEKICHTTGQHLSTLELVSNLLAIMGTKEWEIPSKMASLKTYLGTLGTWINSSRASSLTMDYIQVGYVEDEDDLPRANANFFQSTWFEIRAFISSFFTKYDQMGVVSEADVSEDALNVWLAAGRDQNKIWRSLIDSEFSEYCATSDYCKANNISSIPVALKLITAGTLLPSILADKGPDVYMGLDSTSTINYAIRGAVVPVVSDDAGEGYDDADAYLTEYFSPAAINTIELLGKKYGVPMTMNFPMMFYRLDVLVELQADVPESWDDLLSLLPVLQANNLAAGIAATFETMLYQAGGTMWRYEDSEYYDVKYAGAQIGLDTNVALDAFQFYCRMFTDYSFPYKYDAANRFRTGEMPVIIGDYVTLYNQMVVFATEIAGLWSFSHVPGTWRTNEDGTKTLNYDAIATVTNLVIPYSENRTQDRQDRAWEYVKWNASAKAQSAYGNRMVALIGPSAKYAAANLDAIDMLSWTTKEARAIKDQLDHLNSVKNYPGSYIIARYIDFAFLEAYNNGAEPVDSLQKYISAINIELTRKREEFADSGLLTLENGQTPEQAEAERNN